MIVSINNSRIEGSLNQMVSNIRYAEKETFDISLMVNPVDNLSFDHMLKRGSNISTYKE